MEEITWNMVSNTLYDGIIKVNPVTGTVFVAKEDGLYISKDKGATFNKINSEYIFRVRYSKKRKYSKNILYNRQWRILQ